MAKRFDWSEKSTRALLWPNVFVPVQNDWSTNKPLAKRMLSEIVKCQMNGSRKGKISSQLPWQQRSADFPFAGWVRLSGLRKLCSDTEWRENPGDLESLYSYSF